MREVIQKSNEETFKKKDIWKATKLPKVNGLLLIQMLYHTDIIIQVHTVCYINK